MKHSRLKMTSPIHDSGAWTSTKNEELEFSRETNKLFNDEEQHEQHAQQYTLEKGLKKCGKRGEDAALKEITQLHSRACFEPT